MELVLKNKEWKEFLIGSIFKVQNSKAYHKTDLKEVNHKGISYVSRTNSNNGVESIVKDNSLVKNPSNSIVFGAENATFFYQPNEYITGNKMYFVSNTELNKFSGLFIQMALNSSIKNCGFGYGKGLTGTRVKKRFVKLPSTIDGKPDYDFMELYIKSKEQGKFNDYTNYINKRIDSLKKSKKVLPLSEKEWGEYFLNEIFKEIQRGKRLKKGDHKHGKIPYVSSTAMNNGVDNYVGNKEKVRNFSNCLTLANSGSVGACFFQPYNFVASDHVTKLENENFNKYIYLFISNIVSRLGEKYSFNREINDTRIKREKIMLPINKNGKPDYDYMEQYMKNLEYRKLKQYIDKIEHI